MNRSEKRMLKKKLNNLPKTLHLENKNKDLKYANELDKLLRFAIDPSDKFDPHEIMRKLPDEAFDALYEGVKKHHILKQFECLFQTESQWRQGLLKEDWKWEWTSKYEGEIKFPNEQH